MQNVKKMGIIMYRKIFIYITSFFSSLFGSNSASAGELQLFSSPSSSLHEKKRYKSFKYDISFSATTTYSKNRRDSTTHLWSRLSKTKNTQKETANILLISSCHGWPLLSVSLLFARMAVHHTRFAARFLPWIIESNQACNWLVWKLEFKKTKQKKTCLWSNTVMETSDIP